jgi:hypothetical protein
MPKATASKPGGIASSAEEAVAFFTLFPRPSFMSTFSFEVILQLSSVLEALQAKNRELHNTKMLNAFTADINPFKYDRLIKRV